jgi:hypothetical protein
MIKNTENLLEMSGPTLRLLHKLIETNGAIVTGIRFSKELIFLILILRNREGRGRCAFFCF